MLTFKNFIIQFILLNLSFQINFSIFILCVNNENCLFELMRSKPIEYINYTQHLLSKGQIFLHSILKRNR